MAKRWVENKSNQAAVIGGKLLAPGEGVFVDEGPFDRRADPPILSFEQLASLFKPGSNQRIATYCPMGRIQTVPNGADHTTLVQLTLPCAADRLQLGIVNGTGADWAGVRATLGRLSQSGNKGGTTVNAGTTVNCTFNGASSVTVAGVGGSVDDPMVTWSDWMTAVSSLDRTDTAATGGTLPVHNLRIEIPAAVANRSAYYYTDTLGWNDENLNSAPYGRILRMRKQAGLFATTGAAAGFTSVVNVTDGVPFMLRYIPRLRNVFTLLLFGNSLQEGADATVRNFGWAHELQAMVSTPSAPVEICNLAVSGAGASVDEQRALRLLRDVMPSVVVLMPYNVNDTVASTSAISAAEIDLMRQRLAGVLAECQRLGLPVALATGPASSTSAFAFGASDSLRRNFNDEIRNFARASLIPLLDFAAVLDGVEDGTGQVQPNPALFANGVHPNTPGYMAMAQEARPLVNLFRAQV